MNVADLIRGEKTKLNLGTWASGHVPRSAFPMSRVKEKQYRYGQAYRWRLVQFFSMGYKCRVLILLNTEKEICRFRFGVEMADDMVVLLDKEFHAGEPGWHCHFTPARIDSAIAGVARAGKRRWPRGSDPKAKFGVTESGALNIAAEMFQFGATGSLL